MEFGRLLDEFGTLGEVDVDKVGLHLTCIVIYTEERFGGNKQRLERKEEEN